MKGHAGVKPCLHCSNVLMKRHNLLKSDESLCDISEENIQKFLPATDEEIWATQDHLIEQKVVLGKTPFETLEKCCGQNFEPLGLLACHDLRGEVRPSESLWDPMHSYFSDGIGSSEIDQLLRCLRGIGVSHAVVMEFCNSGWRNHQSKIKLHFKKDGLKGGASDVLAALPLIRHFVLKHVPANALVKEVKSFICLADVTMCLNGLKARSFSCIPDESLNVLSRLQQHHLACFKKAHGVKAVKPKHHYALHIPGQVRKNKFLLDCFTPERKHRLTLAELNAAYGLCPSKPYDNELSLLASVNLVQITEMQSFVFGMLGKVRTVSGLSFGQQGEVAASDEVRLESSLVLKKGDVFFYNATPCILELCVQLQHGLYLLVQKCLLCANDCHNKAHIWTMPDEKHLLSINVLLPHLVCLTLLINHV